jgi:hypothetical protein
MERKFAPVLRPCIYTFCFLIFLGCKGVITSDDLSSVAQSFAQPTFSSSQTNVNLTTPSHTYTLDGFCDKEAIAIEWSTDQVTWTSIPGCAAGTFSISPLTISTVKKFYVRAKGPQNIYSAVSSAKVTYAFPPSAPDFAFVSAGSADDSKMQFGLEHTMTQTEMQDGGSTMTINPSIIGAAVYE